ncbi:hypothetical protein P5_0030 [Aeromonas phage P5]|nr:hypothetical protein P5_0030 [Aeromonas phage P5]
MNKAEAKNLFELALTSNNPNVYKPAYKVLRTVMRDVVLTKRDVMHWMNAINATIHYIASYKLSDGTRQYELCLIVNGPVTGGTVHTTRTITANSWSGIIYKAAYIILGYERNLTMKQLHDIEAWSYEPAHKVDITKSPYKR